MSKAPVYTEKELAVMSASDDTMEAICVYVSGGGTLPEWCELQGVRYGVIGAWVNEDGRLQPYARATMMRAEWFEQTIYKELRGIATLDIRGMLKPDGTVKDVDQWPDELARAVSGLDHDETLDREGNTRTNKKVKLLDKLRALELLMKNRRMLSERVEHSGKVSLEQLLEESRSDASPAALAPVVVVPVVE